MTPEEMEAVLSTADGVWPEMLTADVRAKWWKLTSLDFDLTRAALTTLETGPFPTPQQVIDQTVRERVKNRPAGRCDVCHGTGWVYTSEQLEGGYSTVARCPCSTHPDQEAADHPAACTCLTCHYGQRESALIRAGKGIAYTDEGEAERVREHVAEIKATLGAE